LIKRFAPEFFAPKTPATEAELKQRRIEEEKKFKLETTKALAIEAKK